MKKFIFILTVFLWAGLLIFISFWRDGIFKKGDAPVSVDFSEGQKLYVWDKDTGAFMQSGSTVSPSSPDTLFLQRLSPVDGIYYTSWEQKPFSLTKNDTLTSVVFGKGFFVCNMQTGMEKYEFRWNDLTLTPKWRGIFMIDTRGPEAKIFSFDTFLDIELVAGAKHERVTGFTLFPWLLFSHDPKNTSDLKAADILRISIVDSIRYVDMNSRDDRKVVLSWNDSTFLQIQKDITSRFHAFKDLYNSLKEDKDSQKATNAAFFNTSSSMLINESKKAVFLKNALIENILSFFRDPKKAQKGPIEKTLADMKALDPQVYAEGLSILKQYYYIVRFAHFTGENNSFDSTSPEVGLIALAESIITGRTETKQGEYYMHLSDLFSAYYFWTLNQESLNSYLEEILQSILVSKVLVQEEFLPFVFFTTQYLSGGPALPNEDTMRIIDHLFQITNEYYLKNTIDSTKLATVTSTIFYNYTKIFSKLYGVFTTAFIDKTPKGLLLKNDYAPGWSKELGSDFVETFTTVIGNAKKDIDMKKQDFYATVSLRGDSRIIDSYTLLQSTLRPFDTLIAMFNNYSKYLNDSHLNDSNKAAQGILVDTTSEMSLGSLQMYLRNFNNLNLGTLQVTNNFQKDGFYEVQVIILWNTFHFKLWEQNHMIADISTIDAFGKKQIFPNITLSLDQKEEQLRDLYSSTKDLALQYRYDFKNFFETTFLRTDGGWISNPNTNNTGSTISRPENTPEIQLFIQKELLEKDFKNIASFLPIGFKNITASIDDTWEYVIDLKGLSKTFVGNGNNYIVDMSGKYLFKRHAFSRLVFQVKNSGDTTGYRFNETAIEILPARISLLTTPDTLKDIGYYIDTIVTSYTKEKSIVLDLTGKKVLLDNIPFPVTIESE